MKEKIVEVSRLTKYYGNVIAIKDVSFDVYRGEVFSLIGPNGAGKTTTVEILECLRKPSSGSAKVLGYDILVEEDKIKKNIGVMPQNFNAFERLSVRENVELIARIYGVKTDVRKYLELLGLWELRDRKFGVLSGGMQRRVGICMALVTDPELLFLDEPTTGLDPQARKEVWDVIKSLKRIGKTVFLTTHYMEEVEVLSDRVSIIIQGRILQTSSVSELISKYGGGLRVIVNSSDENERTLRQFAKDVFYDEDGNIVGRFESLGDVGKALVELYKSGAKVRIVTSSMEDVFLNLVGKRINERGELV